MGIYLETGNNVYVPTSVFSFRSDKSNVPAYTIKSIGFVNVRCPLPKEA